MISFEGIGETVVSFYNGESGAIGAGTPVKMSGNGEVSACDNGDKFFGFATDGDNQYVAVQTTGFVMVKYTGTAPGVGFATLLADAAGGVKAAETGREYLVADVNTTDKTLVIML